MFSVYGKNIVIYVTLIILHNIPEIHDHLELAQTIT